MSYKNIRIRSEEWMRLEAVKRFLTTQTGVPVSTNDALKYVRENGYPKEADVFLAAIRKEHE